MLPPRRFKLRTFKETLTDIVFRQPPNVWGGDDFTALDTKLEGLSEQLRLPIYGSRRCLVLQTSVNVGINVAGCHVDGTQVAERRADRLQMGFQLSARPTATACVFLFKRIEQFVNVHLLGAWRERLQSLALGPKFFHAFIEFLLGNNRIRGAGTFADGFAATGIANPPRIASQIDVPERRVGVRERVISWVSALLSFLVMLRCHCARRLIARIGTAVLFSGQ